LALALQSIRTHDDPSQLAPSDPYTRPLEDRAMTKTLPFLRRSLTIAVLTVAGAIVPAADLPASGPPPGIPSGVMPWEYHKYQGYRHGAEPRPRTPPPPVVTRSPRAYTLNVTVLPQQHQDVRRDVAYVVAHLPDDAQLFFEDRPTASRGMLRQFVSPPLRAGEPYHYTVRVVWPEEGEWVSQVVNVPLRAGGVYCVDVIHNQSGELETEIRAALDKLSPEDRALAEGQKSCAVQDGIRLGAMGPPVKVSIQGQPVFLCCPACQAAALKNADETLRKANALKASKPAPPKS
jgi:uncharacterized protein (TIGR03000 family)